ncbi:unnamed protein product [Brassica oleracea var. botrytis]
MVNPMIADFDRLYELMDSTHQGSSRLIRDLREELKNMSREREEAEKTEIDKEESENEVDTVEYWKKKASRLEKSLEESRESKLRLVDSLKIMETLNTGEGFLSFILENSPFIMGHQDILGKIDSEIFNGNGVKEFEEFKRETFLIFVETVYSKTGKKVGINYIGMEVTDQVRKREKMAKLGEDNAVLRSVISESIKIHQTEWFLFLLFAQEMMNAKKILAKMPGELRSPLLGIQHG